MKPIDNEQAGNIFFGFLFLVIAICILAVIAIDHGIMIALIVVGTFTSIVTLMVIVMRGPEMFKWFWNRYIADSQHAEEQDKDDILNEI